MTERPEQNDEELIHPLARPFLWLDSDWLKGSMIWIFAILTVGFASVDFFYHRHEYLEFAASFGFFAWFGFVAFAAAVFIGWGVIRGLLGRPENYWDGEGDNE